MTDKILAGSIGLNVILWVVFAVMDFTGLNGGTTNGGVAALVTAVVLILFYFLSVRHNSRWYYFLVMALLIIILRALAQKFAWQEIVILLTHIITLTVAAHKIKSGS